MKKFTVLVALALIAATGTGYAVTCSQDNVPAATLLVPYFQVSGSAASGTIPAGGVDTTVAITNVSSWGVIAHVTVWNKQSAAVLDFNVPMTGFDVAFFSMRGVLNGNLNVNENVQKAGSVDPCRDVTKIGTAKTQYIRFTHPQYTVPATPGTDYFDSIGFYASPAFSGNFRNKILDSLDESPVYSSLATRPSDDVDNPACYGEAPDGVFTSTFAGYLTIDVVNYCTNWFPDQAQFYNYEAIATRGWDLNGVGPNVLIGDVFYIDPAPAGGNVSGENAVALEFDARLQFPTTWATTPYKTFYGRYGSTTGGIVDTTTSLTGALATTYAFRGDGREPLGSVYGFRYLNDSVGGLQTWATIWRSDVWDADDSSTTQDPDHDVTLCDVSFNGRQISISIWDNDEGQYSQTGGGPSGDTPLTSYTNVWWEANRVSLLDNPTVIPVASWKGGWTRFTFNRNYDDRYHQAYVSVEHTAPGLMVSVGHNAAVLDNQFTCPGAQGPFAAVPGNVAFSAE